MNSSAQPGEKTGVSIEECRNAQLLMLDSFASYCADKGLTFSLVGGTLLGAVRHKGYIPWDDDIDIGMPRPDYESLLDNAADFKKRTGYSLGGYFDTPLHDAPFCKVLHGEIMVHEESCVKDSYLWIDIFPIDGLPEELHHLKKIYNRVAFLRSVIWSAQASPSFSETAWIRLAKKVLSPILYGKWFMPLLLRQLSELGKSIPYGSTPYIGIVSWGSYGIGERFLLKSFSSIEKVQFEGRELPTFSNWQSYLEGIYGNYMELPPEDQRKSHGITAWKMIPVSEVLDS